MNHWYESTPCDRMDTRHPVARLTAQVDRCNAPNQCSRREESAAFREYLFSLVDSLFLLCALILPRYWCCCCHGQYYSVQIVDNFTYVICGDGCLQEGVASEACSLGGHLGLGKLIVLYDDNEVWYKLFSFLLHRYMLT